MLGLFENIGYALEPIGLAIEGAFVQARCDVANHIVDVKLRRKLRKYEKMRSESDEEVEEEEENTEQEELETSEKQGDTSLRMMARTFTSAMMQKSDCLKNNHETGEDT